MSHHSNKFYIQTQLETTEDPVPDLSPPGCPRSNQMIIMVRISHEFLTYCPTFFKICVICKILMSHHSTEFYLETQLETTEDPVSDLSPPGCPRSNQMITMVRLSHEFLPYCPTFLIICVIWKILMSHHSTEFYLETQLETTEDPVSDLSPPGCPWSNQMIIMVMLSHEFLP